MNNIYAKFTEVEQFLKRCGNRPVVAIAVCDEMIADYRICIKKLSEYNQSLRDSYLHKIIGYKIMKQYISKNYLA